MAIEIQPYLAEMVDAVRAFNARVRAGGVAFQFPEHPRSARLPPLEGRTLREEYFLALDGSEVRGGYILKHQPFALRGQPCHIAELRLPMSEGTVNPRYRLVGVQILRDSLRRQPLQVATGMGGFREPVVRLLQSAGWEVKPVPFLFKVQHPSRFLRDIRFLRSSPLRRFALDFLAHSRIGSAFLKSIQAARVRRPGGFEEVSCEPVDDFGDWADALWESCRDLYGLIAVRDREALRILYPRENRRFLKLKISRGAHPVGWALVLDTAMAGHKQFGDLRLGSLVDALASPSDAALVVDQATRFLEGRGVDLIVSNHSHAAWVRALRRAGFLDGPSNFLMAFSTELARRAGTTAEMLPQTHVNRGDGDGPLHL